MAIDGALLRKFEAFRTRVASISSHYDVRPDKLMDPDDFAPLYERWAALYEALRSADSEVDFVPVMPKPSTWSGNPSAYEGRGGYQQGQLQRMRRDIDEVWTIVSHPSKQAAQATLSKEGIFIGGQPFDAMMAVTSIMQAANATISLIDAYIDDRTLQLLSFKADRVQANVLATQLKGGVVQAGKAFIAQYGQTLEIRTTNAFHDRFVIIDDTDFFHFGTSIKDAAIKNTFMFSRIEEKAVVTTLQAEWSKAWQAATPVPL